MTDLQLCGIRRSRIGRKRWQVDIALPDDDPMLAGAGSGASNIPGDPINRLIFYGESSAVLRRLGELLILAADETKKLEETA